MSKIKDEKNRLLFEHWETEQMVEQAMAVQYPMVTAKCWAISDNKRCEVFHGKNQDMQCEVASMTKVCTAYTVCRVLEEMGIYSL